MVLREICSSLSLKTMLLAGFLATTLCCLLLTGLTTRLAHRFGWVRKPTSARHVHTKAIPRLGGVAIFMTMLAFIAAGALGGHAGVALPCMHALAGVLVPASLLFLVGLVDDIVPLPARLKLCCQIGSGVWLYLLGYSVVTFAHPATSLFLRALGLCATVAWVVWITNAVNLIDGLDGLAAGSSLFSLLTLFVAAYLHDNHAVAFGTALLGGAIVGFLRHNFNPASIFLGDGGSLFLGFMLSALGLMDIPKQGSALPVVIALPALALGLPLMEVVLSVSRRFISRKRLFEPDRMHIHHRLLDLGLSHRQAVLMLYGVSGVFGLLALILVYPTWSGLLLSFALLAVLGSLGVMRLGYAEFAELARLPRRTLQQRRVIANSVAISRTVDLLRTATTIDQIRGAFESGLPADCFDEISLALCSRERTDAAHGFRLTAKSLNDADAANPAKLGIGAPRARLIMDLESAEFSGSLEFVMAARQPMLNVDQLFGKLHPALDGAILKLSTRHIPEREPVEMMSLHRPAMLTEQAALGLVH